MYTFQINSLLSVLSSLISDTSPIWLTRFSDFWDLVGHHTIPYMPDPWPGQEDFQGKIIHSHDYKNLHGYEDKVLVVVGIGNSACDTAVDVSRIAKQGLNLIFCILNNT